MEIPKKTLAGAAVFAAINVAWIYLFSFMKLGFLDLFDYTLFFKLTDVSLIFMLVILGVLLAASISVVLYTTGEDKKTELMFFGAAGGVSAVASYFFFQSVFGVLLVLSFVVGCLLLIGTRGQEMQSTFSKLRTGWGAAKKAMLIFAIGAFLASLLFVFVNKADCEAKAKDSLVKFSMKSMSGGLDLQGIISKDDIKGMLCGSVSRESVETLLKAQMGDDWDLLSADKQTEMIDRAYNQSIDNCNNQDYINQAYDSMQQKLSGEGLQSSQPMIEKLIESLPIMKMLMQFLPLLSGAILFSAINLFALIIVNPLTSLFALGLMKKEDGAKPPEKEK